MLGYRDIAPPDAISAKRATKGVYQSIEALPAEILDQVFAYLDAPPPSSAKLYDEPVLQLTFSKELNLKSCSRVCRIWRRLVIPILYKFTRLVLMEPLLSPPTLRDEYVPFIEFVESHCLKHLIQSFSISIQSAGHYDRVVRPSTQLVFDVDLFWSLLFEKVDPVDLKIICSPPDLGVLTGCSVPLQDRYNFDMLYHLLYLHRPQMTTLPPHEKPEDSTQPSSTRLLKIRPWETMLLNEGSFVGSYKFDDLHEKEPPSILGDLIGNEVKDPEMPNSIRDFSYIAIFPTSSHISKITARCPRVDRFYCQFVPRGDILVDLARSEEVDMRGLWFERNSCYALIMRELLSSPPAGNFAYLIEFESGDAADVDAWEMAVEYVKRVGGGWNVVRPGVFAKDEAASKILTGTEGEEEELTPFLFQGQLRRWAFAGVSSLPVSSLGLYFRPQGWQDGQDEDDG